MERFFGRVEPYCKRLFKPDVKIDENTNSDTVWDTLNTVASQLEAFAKNPIQKVEEEHLASVVAAKTNIPVGKIQEGEKRKITANGASLTTTRCRARPRHKIAN